jgi:multisubunit Na+/H+ antiporter MnhB subunit
MTLFNILNEYSFFVAPGFVLAVIAMLIAWRKWHRAWWLALGAGVVVLLIAAVFIRNPRANRMQLDSAENIRNSINTAGRPTLVHFHSHY